MIDWHAVRITPARDLQRAAALCKQQLLSKKLYGVVLHEWQRKCRSPVLGMHEDGLVGGDVQSELPGALLRRGTLVPLVFGLHPKPCSWLSISVSHTSTPKRLQTPRCHSKVLLTPQQKACREWIGNFWSWQCSGHNGGMDHDSP